MDLIARLDLVDALVEERRAALSSRHREDLEPRPSAESRSAPRLSLIERLSVLYGVRRDEPADCAACA